MPTAVAQPGGGSVAARSGSAAEVQPGGEAPAGPTKPLETGSAPSALAAQRTDSRPRSLASAPIRFRGKAQAKREAAGFLAKGIVLQPDAEGRRGRTRLILGLDFGTAYTKVVANIANDRYAIPFDSVVECRHPFLLPAVVSIDGGGYACLGRRPEAVRTWEDLKLHLIDGMESEEEDAAYVAYMALVIRAARAWIFTERRAQLRSEIDWAFHIGMPARGWEDNGMRDRYHALLEAACFVSGFPREVNVAECGTVLRTIRERPSPLKKRVAVYAEFAAQITGYVHSPSARDGPHILVDVGAGTLDVTMFNVFLIAELEGVAEESGGTADVRFPIWDAQVQPLGTYYLVAGCRSRDAIASHEAAQEAEAIEALDAYRARAGDDDAERREHEFQKRTAGVIAQVIRRTKVERYANFPWAKSEVPAFLCGGGARYPLYRKALEQAAAVFPVRLRHESLEVPTTLRAQGVREEDFDRLSVAFGLSHEDPEIGEIRPSWAIEDQPAERGERRDRRSDQFRDTPNPTDRDQVE